MLRSALVGRGHPHPAKAYIINGTHYLSLGADVVDLFRFNTETMHF